MLGVVDHPLALARRGRRPTRRSCAGSPRESTLTTFSRCSPQVLPTSVHTGAPQSASTRSAGSASAAASAAAGHPERGDLGVRRTTPGSAGRTARSPWGSSWGSPPRSGRSRARRAGAPPAASPARTATCPRPACRRGGWCRRARSGVMRSVLRVAAFGAAATAAVASWSGPRPRRATRGSAVAAVQRVVEHALELPGDSARARRRRSRGRRSRAPGTSSAAVPVRNTSSARYSSARARSRSTTS